MKRNEMTPEERRHIRSIEVHGFAIGFLAGLIIGLINLAARLLTAID